METVPIFTRFDEPIVYDTIREQSEIDEIQYDRSSIANLNQANTHIKFYYSGDVPYLLSSSDFGFLVKCCFRTRDNNATNMNSNITLSSNWFGYLFDNEQLRLGGQTIEHINNPAIVMDIFYNMESDEFRKRSGALCGYIPDTISEVSDTIGTRLGNVDGADVAAVLGSLNNANQGNVQTNANYNEGFVKRRRLYNYTIAANDEYREIEIFVSINRIFSFSDKFNIILKYIPFEIVLTR